MKVVRSLLQEAWPHLLTKRIKAGDNGVVPSGCVHLLAVTSVEGLKCDNLSRSETIERIVFLTSELIDELTGDIFSKVCAICIHSCMHTPWFHNHYILYISEVEEHVTTLGAEIYIVTNLGLWISSWNYVCIKISSPLAKIS